MTKHREVTAEDRAEVRRITATPKKSMEDLQESVRAAELYLKENVEDSGLFEFASRALGGNLPDCTPGEGWVAGAMFSELNQKPICGLVTHIEATEYGH